MIASKPVEKGKWLNKDTLFTVWTHSNLVH